MKYNKPFNELGFTTKCAIVERDQDQASDPDYEAFTTHAKSRKAKHKRDRAKILAGVLALRSK